MDLTPTMVILHIHHQRVCILYKMETNADRNLDKISGDIFFLAEG
jgi:hypothetical protein